MNTVARPVRIYFAVPTHYTIGPEFDTLDEATAYARDRIREIEGCPGTFTREFVDVRISDETGDRPVYRTEVFR